MRHHITIGHVMSFILQSGLSSCKFLEMNLGNENTKYFTMCSVYPLFKIDHVIRSSFFNPERVLVSHRS